MGRKRKPIEHHRRDNTFQPCRHSGPEPEATKPIKPDDLTGAAGEMWDALAPVLESMGVYCEADSLALRLLCDSYAGYVAAGEAIRTDGGYIGQKEHPAQRARSRYFKEVIDLMRQFGLTPSSRTGLNIRKPDDDGESELDRILRGGDN